MDPTLQAHLGRTAIIGFTRSTHNFFMRQIIGPAPKVFTHLTFRKRTELAFEITHVGIIYISVNTIGHLIADQLLSDRIRRLSNMGYLVPARLKQPDNFTFRQRLTGDRFVKNGSQGRRSLKLWNMRHTSQITRRRVWRFAGRPIFTADIALAIDCAEHHWSKFNINPSIHLFQMRRINR